MYKSHTGKDDGRFKNLIMLPPIIKTNKKRRRLKEKLNISESPNRFADSLSVLGKTIASSYRSEDMTTMIPIRLR
jgi:hypothetical protein